MEEVSQEEISCFIFSYFPMKKVPLQKQTL